MKINTDKALINLDGSTIALSPTDTTPFTVGKAIANILVTSKSKTFDSFKAFKMAEKFYNEKDVEIDEADFAKIKEIIEKDGQYTALITGQIIQELLTE